MAPTAGRRAVVLFCAIVVAALLTTMPIARAVGYSVENNTLSVTPDGYAQVSTTLSFNATEGAIIVQPYGAPDAYSISATDAIQSAVPFTLNGTSIVLNVLVRTSPVTLVYATPFLTAKNGPFWNLNVTLDTTSQVVLPVNATLVTISSLPADISSTGGQVHLTLGSGTWGMVDFIPPSGSSTSNKPSGASFPPWSYLLVAMAAVAAAGFLVFRRRKKPVVLRPDDEKILAYVRSRGGRTYASDIVNSLGMPKSSVWKALRRLESNGLVKTRKDGNRVVVEA